METDPGTATVRRGLIGMISGDETHRRTNEKPTRPPLTAYGLTATSGTKDGTNGSETHGYRRKVLVVEAAPVVPGLRRYRRCRRRLRPATRRVDMRTLGARAQRARLKAGQGPGSSNLGVALPRRPVPLRLQRPVGRVAPLGGASVLAAARPGTLPREAPWSWLLRASQAASLGVLLSGVRVMGILRFAGLTSVGDLLTGREVRPAPEAQGPPLGSDDEVVKAGAFRFSRHPGNLGARGPLRRVGFFARGAQASGGLWRCLRALLEGGAVSGPRAPKRLGTYDRLIRFPASFQRYQTLELPYRPGQGNRCLP